MTDWLLVNEASFIEYPADPNARKPIKASGVRVLANEAKKEEEHYFIYPKIFDEIIEGFPKNMAHSILFFIRVIKKTEKAREWL